MYYEDFKIGDRVGKFYDNEKIFKIDKEKSLLDKIINTDFLEDMCSEETANEYKKLIKEEIEEIKQKAFEDGQTSIIKRYISKDKIKKEIEYYKFLQNDELIKFPDRFTDKYFVYSDIIKVLEKLLKESE